MGTFTTLLSNKMARLMHWVFESIGGKICLIAEEGRLTQIGNVRAINSDFSEGKVHVLGERRSGYCKTPLLMFLDLTMPELC